MTVHRPTTKNTCLMKLFLVGSGTISNNASRTDDSPSDDSASSSSDTDTAQRQGRKNKKENKKNHKH